jgi:hypothetical protein
MYTERIDDDVTDVKARLRQLEKRVGGQAEFSLRAAVRETLRAADDGLTAGRNCRATKRESGTNTLRNLPRKL